MNKDQFHKYLSSPNQLNADTLAELNDLVEEYPYFQAARMLYVKNLKNIESIRLNKQLKNAAAYINDRRLLFGLLNDISIKSDGSFYSINHDGALERGSSAGNYAVHAKGILSLLDDGNDDGNSDINSDFPAKYDKSLYVQELERFIPIADLDLLLIDFPIDDPDTLDFDFDDILPEISDKPVLKEDDNNAAIANKGVSSRELIDEFIRKSPRMPKASESDHKTNAIQSDAIRENEGLMTETLAEIYLKQGYYYRALQAYEKLSLNNPEKSIYFASQIQKIKELIKNQ